MLTRDEILTTDDILAEDVPIPEWGGTIRVRALNGAQREELEIWCEARKRGGQAAGLKGVKAKLFVLSVIDEQGQCLLTDNDIPALQAKSGAAIDRVATVASRLSGLSWQDAEDLAGNSDAGPTGDSGSI